MSDAVRRHGPVTVSGRLRVPADKSISHRALIYSALAEGRASVGNLLGSADCLNTLGCLRALGVEIELNTSSAGGDSSLLEAIVAGRGLFGLAEPSDVLDVGNSGTALRVLPGVLAAQDFTAFMTGDASIRRRPVDRIIEPLSLMGARIYARASGRLAPLAVVGGPLKGVEYTLPVASAQVKTAVLTAGLLAEGETTVIEPLASRDHSELMLDYLGADIRVDMDRDSGVCTIKVRRRPFAAKDIDIPGDISSAAFFITAGVLAADETVEVTDIGLNPTRMGFLEVLARMGAALDIKDERASAGEPVGSVIAARSSLRGTEIGGAIIPKLIDELPLVALLATQAEGRTVVCDAAELRVKETDRITLVAAELNRMGARITPTGDGFVIDGPTPLKGAVVLSHGDHRLAMMLAVAALVADGETVIEGAEAVDVSFPDFFDRLERIEISS